MGQRSAHTVFTTIHYQNVRRAFNTWEDAAHRVSKGRQDARAALLSMRHQESRRAFSTWSDMVECTLNAHERARVVINALRHQSSRRAFTSWATIVHRTRLSFERIRYVVMTLRNKHCRLALTTWASVVRHTSLRQQNARTFVNGLRHQHSRRAFSTWALTSQRLSKRRWNARSVLLSFHDQTTRRAFLTWMSISERELLARQRARTVLISFCNQSLRRALSTWIAEAWRLIGSRHSARAVVAALRHQNARRGLSTWAAFALSSEGAARRLAVAVREWQGFSVRSSWHLWEAYYVVRARCLRIILQIVHRALALAMRSWQSTVSLATELAVVYRRGASVFSAGKRSMRRGFSKLREYVEGRRHLHAYATAMRMSVERRALLTWERVASERQSRRQMATLMARRMLGTSDEHYARGSMRRAFWLLKSSAYAAVVAAFEAQFACLDEPDDPIAAAADRRRSLRWATTLWNGGVAARRRVLQAWSALSAARAFRKWMAVMENVRRLVECCRLVALSLERREAVAAWRRWGRAASAFRAVHAITNRLVCRSRQSYLRSGMAAFHSALQTAHVHANMRRAAASMRVGMAARAAFNKWSGGADTLRQRRRLLAGQRTELRRLQLLAWFRRAATLRGARARADRAMRRWTNAHAVAAFATLRQLVSRRRLMRRVVLRLSHRKLALGLTTLQAFHADRLANRATISHAIASLLMAQIARAFRSWAGRSRELVRIVERTARLLTRTQFAGFAPRRKALQLWRRLARNRELADSQLERAVKRWRGRNLLVVLRMLRLHAVRTRDHEAKMLKKMTERKEASARAAERRAADQRRAQAEAQRVVAEERRLAERKEADERRAAERRAEELRRATHRSFMSTGTDPDTSGTGPPRSTALLLPPSPPVAYYMAEPLPLPTYRPLGSPSHLCRPILPRSSTPIRGEPATPSPPKPSPPKPIAFDAPPLRGNREDWRRAHSPEPVALPASSSLLEGPASEFGDQDGFLERLRDLRAHHERMEQLRDSRTDPQPQPLQLQLPPPPPPLSAVPPQATTPASARMNHSASPGVSPPVAPHSWPLFVTPHKPTIRQQMASTHDLSTSPVEWDSMEHRYG